MPFTRPTSPGRYLATALLSATLMAGCGGGGSGDVTPSPSPSPVVSPSPVPLARAVFALRWAARSRSVNPPGSALSVRVVLPGARADGGDVSVVVNRSESSSEYAETVTLPEPGLTGPRQVVITCYAQRDGGGAIVATGQAGVTIATDGGGIGDIALANTITSVTVAPNQTMLVGTRADLGVTARDAAGALVPVTPGSVFLAVNNGEGRLRIVAGQAEGLTPGAATVFAAVDGVSSPGVPVQVLSEAVVAVTPPAVTLVTGRTQPFGASVTKTDNQAVTWSVQEGASGGTITGDGLYQAPATAGTYHVVATSQYDPTKQGTATVTVVPPAPQLVYSNDFGSAVGPEWSKTDTAITPIGGRRFLGIFGKDAPRLSLAELPPHKTLTVTFKLYLIRTWDGNMISNVVGQDYGPDIWSLTVDGQSLLRTTFSNWEPGTFFPNAPQSFPANVGGGVFPGRQNASENNTLGYPSADPYPGPYQDSVYTLTYTVSHTAPTASIAFSGLETLNGGVPGDEGWGIDDVQIRVTE